MKYFIASTFIFLLALLSIGDGFIFVMACIAILPCILLVQCLTLFISKRLKVRRQHAGFVSLLPSVAVSVWILATMSLWVQPNQAFKLVFGDGMPSSVKNFHFTEEAWTDYSTQFYFDISPPDLKRILRPKNFQETTWSTTSERVNFDEMKWISVPLEPIANPICYMYEIPGDSEGEGAGFCELYTNHEHNRVYLLYAVD